MQISSSTASTSSNYTMNTGSIDQDEQIKSMQKQIKSAQQELQSLSQNESLSAEEKIEKRKELQQQIQDLNKQVSQRKVEIQQERREAAQVDTQETSKTNTDKEDSVTISTGTMQGFISDVALINQVDTIQSVKSTMENRVGILDREIETDKSRGASTEKKEVALAELNSRIDTAADDIAEKISDINKDTEKSKETTDEQEAIAREQDKGVEEGSETDPSDVQEQKNSRNNKPVIYTKTGTANEQESGAESGLSVLI